MSEPRVDFSIVIPVYFNEGSVTKTFESLRTDVIAKQPHRVAEIVFVDDGSGDGSLAELVGLQQAHPELIRVVKLTRNFGQVAALYAGFRLARGACVVMLSADGQDPAHLINQMLAGHFEEGYEIVACNREGRDESAYRVWTSRIFYWLMRRLAFPNLPAGGFDFVLLSRRALDPLLENYEAHPFLQGQILWLGFPIKFISYRRLERQIGTSRWTFGKKLTYLIDGVMSYSFVPIRLISVLGILVALLGFGYAIALAITKIVWGVSVEGWTGIMVAILVTGGLQILMLGVIGEYLWRSLAQSRRRPAYVIDRVYDRRAE